MAETPETKPTNKLDGIAIGGTVVSKNHYPARSRDGFEMPESWRVDIAYLGGTAPISVTPQLFDRIPVGSYKMFLVTQRAGKNGAIYNTAIEQ
jgi:hypothetical protein